MSWPPNSHSHSHSHTPHYHQPWRPYVVPYTPPAPYRVWEVCPCCGRGGYVMRYPYLQPPIIWNAC